VAWGKGRPGHCIPCDALRGILRDMVLEWPFHSIAPLHSLSLPKYVPSLLYVPRLGSIGWLWGLAECKMGFCSWGIPFPCPMLRPLPIRLRFHMYAPLPLAVSSPLAHCHLIPPPHPPSLSQFVLFQHL
jgi:hypothetical protein